MPSSVHTFFYLHKVFCDIILEEMHERKQDATVGGSV